MLSFFVCHGGEWDRSGLGFIQLLIFNTICSVIFLDHGSNLAVAWRALSNRVDPSRLSLFLSECFLPLGLLFVFFLIFPYQIHCDRARFSRRMVNAWKIGKTDQNWVKRRVFLDLLKRLVMHFYFYWVCTIWNVAGQIPYLREF